MSRRALCTTFAAQLLTVALLLPAACSVYTPTGERPLTVKEQVYQAGGVLLGLMQELDFAIRNGTIKKESETARALVKSSEVAFTLYRQAVTFALAENDPEAGRTRLELLRLVDLLRRDLTVALVKP